MEDRLTKLEKELQDAQDKYSKLETSYTLSIGIAKATIELIQAQIEDLKKEEFSELAKVGSYYSRKNNSGNAIIWIKILDNDGENLTVDKIVKEYDELGRLSSYHIDREKTEQPFTKYSYENEHWCEITKDEFEKEII